MKSAICASMFLFLCGVISFPISLSARSGIQSLDEQAIREAKRAWLSLWTECSGSHVARFDGEHCIDIACTGGRRRSPLYLSQRKDVYFIVTESRRLSEADRLNGVSWFGEVRAKWVADREYSFKSNRWSDWRTPTRNAVFVLERRNGRWNVRSASMESFDSKVTKITCANVSNPSSNVINVGRTQTDDACGYKLGSGIRTRWEQAAGVRGNLGCPLMSEADAPRSPYGTTGRYANFKGNGNDAGAIYWHGVGKYTGQSFLVWGCIFGLYNNLDRSSSWLGFPISDEYDAPGGRRSDFEGGYVYWNGRTGRCEAFKYENQ